MNRFLPAWLRARLLPGRHTIYYELLDALQEEGCPVCRLALKAESWYLDMLSYEAVNDPGMRTRLRAARGFCNYHAWQFTREVRNGAGRATIYRDVLASLRGALAAPSQAVAGRLAPTGECPACHSLAGATHRYLECLVLLLGDAELRRRYQAPSGLCLPHLRQALALQPSPDDAGLLMAVAARWAGSLRVATRDGVRGPTLAIVAGAVGGPGAVLPGPLLDDTGPAAPPSQPLAEGEGCPVCRAAVAAAEGCLAARPANALALCNPHAWRSLELLSPGGGARLWQPAARAMKAQLAGDERGVYTRKTQGHEGFLGGLVRRRQVVPAAIDGPGPCRACRAQSQAEQAAGLTLLQAPGERAGTLCLPHLTLCLRLAPAATQRGALIAAQQAALRGLLAELDEYIRKQDFYCREARGPEADSPWRAVAHTAGAEGLAAGALGWGKRG